MMTNEL